MKLKFILLIQIIFILNIWSEIPLPGSGDKINEKQKVEFRAYLESSFISEEQEDQNILINQNRARLDLNMRPSELYSLGFSIVANTYSGESSSDFNNYIPQALRDDSNLYLLYEYEDEIKIQEAFASYYGDNYTFKIGRQKYYSGVGWAFNPVDLFNQKNATDPSYELDGLDIVLLNFDLSSISNIDFLFRSGDEIDNSDFQAKLKLLLGSFDFSFIYSNVLKERLNWENPGTEDPYGRSRWQMFGADFVGEIYCLNLYGEFAYIFANEINNVEIDNPINQDHERILLGFDYTFDFQLYFVAEYLRNGLGKEDKGDLNLNDFAAYYSGESISIMQDNLLTGFSFPISDLIDLSFYNIISMNDSSALIYPGLTFSLGDGINAYFNIYFPYGDEDSAYGSSVLSALFRIKFSF